MSTASLKKVNLDQIQRPKTLIVIHYRGKRVSIPLFQSIDNITEYLWHQLHKFETTILQKQQKNRNSGSHPNINDIMGFTSFQQDKSKIDIKMNILLSMSRLYRDQGKSRSDIKLLDITSYYKYLQIEPYYGRPNQKELIPEYQLYSVLKAGSYFTVYLGRKISDGRFCAIKICKSDTKLALNQFNSMKIIQYEQTKSKGDSQLIPQIQQIRKAEGLFIYIFQYCPGGTLRTCLKKRLNQIQCLHYMKQLVWGIHTMHSVYNLIYRALSLDNIEVDFVGNLRLTNFAYCQPCYSSNYLVNPNISESYEQRYEISNVITPPEVQRSSKYNNLVDYYGIGAILNQMFNEPNNLYQSQTQKQGIQIAIDNFMAENLKQRQLFCNEIVAELRQEKRQASPNSSKRYEQLQHQRLTINKIYIGESINVQQKQVNGIKHEQVIKLMKPSHDDHFYYLHPVHNRGKSKNKSKSKQKSKQKIKQPNKKKSRSKDKIPNKSHQSNSLNTASKLTKLGIKNNQKSLNKSIDSKGTSVKSAKSKSSNSKLKDHKTSNQILTQTLTSGTQPKQSKSPSKVVPWSIKSPPKSPMHKLETIFTNKDFNQTKSKTRF